MKYEGQIETEPWTAEHVDYLKKLNRVYPPFPNRFKAQALNEKFKTKRTTNSVIGKTYRLKQA